MKNSVLFFLCLLILSCNQNKSTSAESQSADNQTQTAAAALEAASSQAETHDSVAFKVWKLLVNDGKDYPCPEGSTLQYNAGDLSEAEGYMIDETIYCFPKKDGSYLAVLEHIEAAEGQGGEYDYTFWIYSNGKVIQTVNDLPVPEFADLIVGPEQRLGQDDVVAKLESLYKERPRDFLRYLFWPEDGKIGVELGPLSYGRDVEPDSEGHYNWLEQFWELRKDYDDNNYKWNGEGFVKTE